MRFMPPDKALHLTSHSGFHLGSGSLPAPSAVLAWPSEVQLAAAERPIRWPSHRDEMPKRTLELLDDLVAAGFSDEDFRVVHHMPDATIKTHRDYCEKTDDFAGPESTNARVRRRLEFIASAYRSPDNQLSLRALAREALAAIPK